jgi:hypothetical protein
MCDFIQLYDEKANKLLDTVAGAYEDSFSLETFASIINAHRDADPPGTKSAIIARVQTWDRNQPDRAFYSYYDAIQLNKILFKTQVYMGQKLIHRLHVLNPLTNTDILGNVLYFKVCKPEEAQALDDLILNTNRAGGPGLNNATSTDVLTTLDPKPLKRKNKPHQLQFLQTQVESFTLSGPVVARDKDQENIVTNAVRRMSVSVRGPIPAPVEIARRLSMALGYPQNPHQKVKDEGQIERGTGLIVTDTIETKVGNVKRRTTHVYKESAPVSVSRRALASVSVPPGSITQFSQPVQDKLEVPEQPYSRGRELSFANSAPVLDSEKYQEWLQMMTEKIGSARSLNALTEGDEMNENAPAPEVSQTDSSRSVVFKARLIGTDMEFLESSKLRAIFRNNAVNPDEAKLLEMPPVNEGDAERMMIQLDDDWLCCGGFEKRILQVFVGLIVIALIVMFVYTLHVGGGES